MRPPLSPEPGKSGFSSQAYLSEDTICAITTAVGGAITVIRVSGRLAFPALKALRRSAAEIEPPPRKLVRAALFSECGSQIDDALIARFVAPQSFTGEDVVEFHLHGGGFIASRLLESLSKLQIRQALPGEFSFRAVRNGKISLSQAQAVVDLITAGNEGALALALEKMSGTQNALVGKLAADLRELAVFGEVGIDFADQDIDEVSLPRLKARLYPVLETLKRLHSSYARGLRLQEGVSVAFIGLPNAGKSSFFNCLLGEDRSIVTDIPGTTRDVVRERLTLRGDSHTVTLRLEDTAGLRATNNPVERIGIERSEKSARDADLILFVVECQDQVAAAQELWQTLEKTLGSGLVSKTIGILSKCDRVDVAQIELLKTSLNKLGIRTWIPTSAHSGAGIDESIQSITTFCGQWVKRSQGEVLLTRFDQVTSVANALDHLDRARNAAELDLFAADLRQALAALGPLIGETLPDDLLGRIFSDFCIGK